MLLMFLKQRQAVPAIGWINLHAHRDTHFVQFVFNLAYGVSAVVNHAGNKGCVCLSGCEGVC